MNCVETIVFESFRTYYLVLNHKPEALKARHLVSVVNTFFSGFNLTSRGKNRQKMAWTKLSKSTFVYTKAFQISKKYMKSLCRFLKKKHDKSHIYITFVSKKRTRAFLSCMFKLCLEGHALTRPAKRFFIFV